MQMFLHLHQFLILNCFVQVTQLSPSVLKSEGIPVYRVVQNPGEFVLTLPRAYHSGFNCGFNCAEAVNVAPVDWLPHGQCAVELYRDQRRKTSISHDKLLLKTVQTALRQVWANLQNCKSGQKEYIWLDTCGKNGMLTSAFKTRIKLEGSAREANALLQCKKMDQDYDSTDRECFSCFYDLHLSAVSCQCSPNRFACLTHANLLCSCEMDRKFVLHRYSMEELNALVAALEGDPAAVYQWKEYDVGLVCQSASTQQKMCFSKSAKLSGSIIDVNIDCGFDGCEDLDKSAGYPKEKEVQNRCVNLNIKEELVCSSSTSNTTGFSSSTFSALRKIDKDKMAMELGSLQTRSTLPSKTTKELFGIETEYCVAKASCAQVSQLGKPSSSQSNEVSWPANLRHQVEQLDHGTVIVGKNWCNHQAIFPKGFRSRVTFYSVLDPTRICCYISEVIDAGLLEPLFRVAVEEFPEVYFTHTSPMQCWDSVRDRVNEEIKKQCTAGKSPALLSNDSVNGLEMFGFLSPPIIEVIEALDPDHKCLDYWLSKHTPPLRRLLSESLMTTMVDGTNNSSIRLLGVDIASNESERSSFHNNSCAEETKLSRLLKKAKWPEEQELIVMNKAISGRMDNSAGLQDEMKNYVDK
ncbi:unnamed protein product [Triticum turgidum subsp. durum]|uniref:JmjC domain-containing protein n=1 Tax=Triticum turgidum subsp. durum TaxID=4567 RepID=A0A9R0QS38_TRITD|nr:unnamed protein product [Triticum turgidum subsp. durum]